MGTSGGVDYGEHVEVCTRETWRSGLGKHVEV